ncbi:MAG: threonine synthase, partial [Candidatus Ranarchaeia archaeon]
CDTPGCKGRLDILYDYGVIEQLVSKKDLEKRKEGVWKYFEFLPVLSRDNIISLGEGGTPFIKATRLADHIGIKDLYTKDETRNPSGSFKDRPMTVGVSKAVEHGAKVLATASSGNAAAGMATYGAKAGIPCYTFVPDFAPAGKIAQLQLLGAKVVRLAGFEGEDPTAKLLRLTVDKYGWTPCPSFGYFNPYQTEGPKTIGYELAEHFGWSSPDWVIVQVGGAGLLTGVYRGFKEFYEMGWIDRMPRIAVVQSDGCAPLVRAWQRGEKFPNITPWEKVDTVAEGLEDPFPWDADVGLEAIKETDGIALVVSNAEILEAQRLLAKYEGLFGEPSGTTGLAALIKLLEEGTIDKTESVVHILSGAGLKDPEVVIRQFKTPPVIRPDLKEFAKVFNISE